MHDEHDNDWIIRLTKVVGEGYGERIAVTRGWVVDEDNRVVREDV